MDAVIDPAEKLPLASLVIIVFAVLLEVAADKIVFIAVMLVELEAILFVSVNSAALAVAASETIAAAFAEILAVLDVILLVRTN